MSRTTAMMLVAVCAVRAGGAAARAADVPHFHRVRGNLVKNAGFERDWIHRAFANGRRFLLLQASDMGVGESDGRIDHWRFRGAASPACWARSSSMAPRW